MSRFSKSHSVSLIHHNRLFGIRIPSVSQLPAPKQPTRRPRLRKLVIHPYFQRLCESTRSFEEIRQSASPVEPFPEHYITDLSSSAKEEKILKRAPDSDQSSKEESKKAIEELESDFTMSSKRSGHGSSSHSSRRQHTSRQSTAQLIESLNTRRINTLTELRRIERIAAAASPEDQLLFQTPMTSAWTAYVTSNNLLNELRGLTRNYPFSNEALDDAKWRVSNDPESNRSWNYAWLVLVKLRDAQLISAYAMSEAAKPEMWGGMVPDQTDVDQLAACFVYEWNEAVETMLRHWETPPTTTGY